MNSEQIREFGNTIIREGRFLTDKQISASDGEYRIRIIKWQNRVWYICMKNGEFTDIVEVTP